MLRAKRKRRYELKQRAESQAATRQRIVEAIVALHEDVGPAKTTISAVAERAGVERLTVYRHFPNELAQFSACSSHWQAGHPLPDFVPWLRIDDPRQRLRRGLTEWYGYFGRGRRMLRNILRDAEHLPALRQVMRPFEQYLHAMAEILAEGWEVRPVRRPLLLAAIRHAVQFQTWQSLVEEQNLPAEDAVELMVRLVAGAAESTGIRS